MDLFVWMNTKIVAHGNAAELLDEGEKGRFVESMTEKHDIPRMFPDGVNTHIGYIEEGVSSPADGDIVQAASFDLLEEACTLIVEKWATGLPITFPHPDPYDEEN